MIIEKQLNCQKKIAAAYCDHCVTSGIIKKKF